MGLPDLFQISLNCSKLFLEQKGRVFGSTFLFQISLNCSKLFLEQKGRVFGSP